MIDIDRYLIDIVSYWVAAHCIHQYDSNPVCLEDSGGVSPGPKLLSVGVWSGFPGAAYV